MTLQLLLVTFALSAASCRFRPDYSRFAECREDGTCEPGFQCWQPEWRCVPLCGEELSCDGGEFVEPTDAGEDAGQRDGGVVDGGVPDAGEDAGWGPLKLDAGTPLRAVELEPYGWRFQAFGGVPPYAFVRVDGGLPPGILLTSDGELTGTTAAPGSYPFELRALDQSLPFSQTDTAGTTLRVSPLLRIATHPPLTDAVTNSAYSEQLYATGGTPPFFWTLDAGSSLPAGLQLSASGAIAGTVTGATVYSFGAVVTDSDTPPQQKQRAMTLTVRGNGLGPEFFTHELADGRTGESYSQQLRASGGSPPLTFTQTAGALPPGLTFSAPNITGIPTDAGTYNVSFRVNDTVVGQQNASFSITVF